MPMKVIAGKYKNRRLSFVKNQHVRPMTQMVREAIFDILREQIVEATMLDLFCGSGSVGIEALSRGAVHVDFVDLDVGMVGENVKRLGLQEAACIYRRDAFDALRVIRRIGKVYDVIFVGAPYAFGALASVVQTIGESGVLRAGGALMLEHRKGREVPQECDGLTYKRRYAYGQTLLSFYESSV